MRIDGNISDLFFNFDLDDDIAVHDGNGQFVGYDEVKLRAKAEMFLGYLDRLGVPIPAVDDLIADFHARV